MEGPSLAVDAWVHNIPKETESITGNTIAMSIVQPFRYPDKLLQQTRLGLLDP